MCPDSIAPSSDLDPFITPNYHGFTFVPVSKESRDSPLLVGKLHANHREYDISLTGEKINTAVLKSHWEEIEQLYKSIVLSEFKNAQDVREMTLYLKDQDDAKDKLFTLLCDAEQDCTGDGEVNKEILGDCRNHFSDPVKQLSPIKELTSEQIKVLHVLKAIDGIFKNSVTSKPETGNQAGGPPKRPPPVPPQKAIQNPQPLNDKKEEKRNEQNATNDKATQTEEPPVEIQTHTDEPKVEESSSDEEEDEWFDPQEVPQEFDAPVALPVQENQEQIKLDEFFDPVELVDQETQTDETKPSQDEEDSIPWSKIAKLAVTITSSAIIWHEGAPLLAAGIIALGDEVVHNYLLDHRYENISNNSGKLSFLGKVGPYVTRAIFPPFVYYGIGFVSGLFGKRSSNSAFEDDSEDSVDLERSTDIPVNEPIIETPSITTTGNEAPINETVVAGKESLPSYPAYEVIDGKSVSSYYTVNANSTGIRQDLNPEMPFLSQCDTGSSPSNVTIDANGTCANPSFEPFMEPSSLQVLHNSPNNEAASMFSSVEGVINKIFYATNVSPKSVLKKIPGIKKLFGG